jgi:hypothetical protein
LQLEQEESVAAGTIPVRCLVKAAGQYCSLRRSRSLAAAVDPDDDDDALVMEAGRAPEVSMRWYCSARARMDPLRTVSLVVRRWESWMDVAPPLTAELRRLMMDCCSVIR